LGYLPGACRPPSECEEALNLPVYTTICLVRHGVTQWNYDGRAQGHTDAPLAEEGRRQAEAVADRLAQERWDAIYSSPLSRAWETAAAIAARTGLVDIRPDDRLKERCAGALEGLTYLDRVRIFPNGQPIPGFESDSSLCARVTAALSDIAERHAGQRVICVSHGAAITIFLRSIAPEMLRRFNLRNTSVTLVRFDGARFTVEALPDHQHLLIDGVEYSGVKNRELGPALVSLFPGYSPEVLDTAVLHASAVETAWVGDQVVAFARLFTDRVLCGYVDMVRALPGYTHLIPRLIDRLQARYPNVPLVRVSSQSISLGAD
jgi:probable phosphoglycerate mutase